MIGTAPAPALGTRTRRVNDAQPGPPASLRSVQLSPVRACLLTLLFPLGVVGLGLLKSVRQNPTLLWSFLGAAAGLLAWPAMLFGAEPRSRQRFRMDISMRRQH